MKGIEKHLFRLHQKIINDEQKFVYRDWALRGGFSKFKKDIEPIPEEKMDIVKKDESLPYCPENFKWIAIPKKEVVVVKRPFKLNRNCYTVDFNIKPYTDVDKSGIYKLSFDNGTFYIGSTKNFRSRIGCFVGSFNGTSRLHNKKFVSALLESNSVIFEVLYYMEDNLKDYETIEISKHISNPLLLNRSHDAHSNKGVKWTEEEKKSKRDTLVFKYKTGVLKADKRGRKKEESGCCY